MRQVDTVRTATDATIGVSAITSPFWLQLMEQGLGFYVTLVGSVLVTIRLALAVREWRQGSAKKESD